jgi:uncharacterized OB-fold protein
MTTAKPLPVPDEWSAGYWEAAARGELALPRCSVCRHFAMPPTMVCPTCGTTDPRFVYEVVERGGTIRSWTVVRDAFLPGFQDDLPYVLVDVELDAESELRLIGRLVEGTAATLRIGDRVTVTFDTVADGVAVPSFTLAVA